jgi:hypothetical protein
MKMVASKMDVEYQTHHIQCLESVCQIFDHKPAPDTTILLSNLQQEIIQDHQDLESALLLKQLFICKNVSGPDGRRCSWFPCHHFVIQYKIYVLCIVGRTNKI